MSHGIHRLKTVNAVVIQSANKFAASLDPAVPRSCRPAITNRAEHRIRNTERQLIPDQYPDCD